MQPHLHSNIHLHLQEARKVIQDHDKSSPLFLYLPLMSIHTPHVGMPPKRYSAYLSIGTIITTTRFRGLYDKAANGGFESSSDLRLV